MNRKEYNEVVTLWADALYRFILKYSRNEELSDDVVQESFITLWEHHDQLDYSKAKSYLFTTAYRKMIDMIRRRRFVVPLSEAFDFGKECTEIDHFNLCETLDKAFERLPDIQRAVVLLRDYEGYAYKEIAEITELTETQVKVYIFRARCTLREFIKDKSLLV